ncbi:MAG: M20 family metallopeptidase [Anaerolineae bacterium]|jgi:amidohydrolase
MDNTTTVTALKERVVAEVDARRQALVDLADAIHARPELGFQEFEAAALLTGILAENGFRVEQGVAGLETAFVAGLDGGTPGPTVAFLAEYDALAGLGHACGHNLIAAAAVGAGLALKALLPELAGQIRVIGTPAEEGGGGKALMVDAGLFDGIDAAMMIHPAGENLVGRLALTAYPVAIKFYGQAAHAAADPDLGINALEALLLTFNAINALRQHLRDDVRIHGIVAHGGQAPNIVPDYAEGRFSIRALDTPYAAEVVEKVRACARGAALATGARLEFEQTGPRYDARWPNPRLVTLFQANLESLGRQVQVASGDERMGSSDIGNVSQVVPAIHPYVAIGPESLIGHSAGFRDASASPAGHRGLLDGAKALAMTAVDLLAEPANLAAARAAFEDQKAAQGA